jgi:hypothetical protein
MDDVGHMARGPRAIGFLPVSRHILRIFTGHSSMYYASFFSQLGLINLHKRISCDVYDRLVAALADNSIFLSKGTKPQAHVKV